MTKVGIDSISYYIPQLYLSLEDLAHERGIEYQKLNKGLGLTRMAVPDSDEDSASMAANAIIKLIEENELDPNTIGRVYLGTESALDASKPTSSYAVGVVEQYFAERYGEESFKHCDVLDMTFACLGGVDALQNSLDWVRAGKNRKAIVVASDTAKYELESSGEYTQGAGAVAVLVKQDPTLLQIGETWGVAMKSVGDFFKPRRVYDKVELLQETSRILGKELTSEDANLLLGSVSTGFWSSQDNQIEVHKDTPVFDGQFSNTCYQDRISEALEHYKDQLDLNVLEDWQYLVFHLPYAFQGRRMIVKNWAQWMNKNGKMAELEEEIGEAYPDSTDAQKMWFRKLSKSPSYRSFVERSIAPGERASMEIGNMYTASIFMSLISLLRDSYERQVDLSNSHIGFLAYGSGSKSKVFEGVVQDGWRDKVKALNIFEELSERRAIGFSTYEDLHKKALDSPVSENGIRYSHSEEGELTVGLRRYK